MYFLIESIWLDLATFYLPLSASLSQPLFLFCFVFLAFSAKLLV